jgi:uncharacterized protein (DUF2141 family)
MRCMFKIVALLILFIVSESAAETLTLQVSQLRSLKGNLIIYLWHNPNAYLMKSGANHKVVVDLEQPQNTPVNGAIHVKIEGLQHKAYAMMLYHDENRSYSFERNLVGIPMEGFAFGNNARPNLGAPKFQEAAIHLLQPEVVQHIKVLY